jgi:hypothetical protein
MFGNKPIANLPDRAWGKNQPVCLNHVGKNNDRKIIILRPSRSILPPGPHGFTFLHHAQRGGDEAKELLEFFQGKD